VKIERKSITFVVLDPADLRSLQDLIRRKYGSLRGTQRYELNEALRERVRQLEAEVK